MHIDIVYECIVLGCIVEITLLVLFLFFTEMSAMSSTSSSYSDSEGTLFTIDGESNRPVSHSRRKSSTQEKRHKCAVCGVSFVELVN